MSETQFPIWHRLPQTQMRWWLVIVMFLASLVAMAILPLSPITVHWLGIVKFASFVVIASLVPLITMRPVRRWHLGLSFEHGSVLRVAVFTVLGVVAMTVVAQVFSATSDEAAESSNVFAKSLGLGDGNKWRDLALILTICVAAPIGEEALFRAGILRALFDGLRRFRKLPTIAAGAIALCVSAALFADSHGGAGQDAQVIALAVDGVVFGLIYMMSGSIWAPVLAHCLNNTSAILLLIADGIIAPDQIAIWAAYAAPVLTIAVMALWRALLPR